MTLKISYPLLSRVTFALLLIGAGCGKKPSKQRFHDAIRTGNTAQVEAALAQGADVNEKDDNGRTVLHSAAFLGRARLVEFLIKHGADVNIRTPEGLTPLHLATKRGDATVVALLIENGADVNALDDDPGHTPLDMAQNDQIISLLRSHGGKTGNELK